MNDGIFVYCLSLQSCFVIKVKIWLGNREEGSVLSF